MDKIDIQFIGPGILSVNPKDILKTEQAQVQIKAAEKAMKYLPPNTGCPYLSDCKMKSDTCKPGINRTLSCGLYRFRQILGDRNERRQRN